MMIFLFLINSVWAQIDETPLKSTPEVRELTPIQTLPLKVGGYLDFVMRAHSLPTSKRGRVDYTVEEMPLRFVLTPMERHQATVEHDFANNRLREANYQMSSLLAETDELQVGVLRRLWYGELEKRTKIFAAAGLELRPLGQKYNYDQENDTGFLYQRRWPEANFVVAVGSLNGEGGVQTENGASKESFLFLRRDWDYFSVLLFYSSGAYDQYSGAENKKERWQWAMQYIFDQTELRLEFLLATDPAQAIKDRSIADGVDVISQLGERIHGAATRLQIYQSWRPQWGILGQYDYVQPDRQQRLKNFGQWTLGAAYQWTPRVQSWLAWNQGDYGSEHLASTRESKRISFATRLNF